MLLKTYVEELPRGGRKKLAIQLGVSSSYLSRLLSGDRSITAERALQIESVTQGSVTRYELRPDLQWGITKRGKLAALVSPSPTLNETVRPNPAGYQSTDGAGVLSSSAGGA